MKKKYVSRDVLIVSVCTLITILVWIGFDVYRIFTQEEQPYVPADQLVPLNPKIDQEIIDQVAQGAFWEKGEYTLPVPIPPREEAPSETEEVEEVEESEEGEE
jgi:hypothetical protein